MPTIRRMPDPNRDNERILTRLERRYDRATKHVRDYYSALNDIKNLKTSGYIDQDHADLLIKQARAEYKETEEKKNIERLSNKHEPIPIEREPVDYTLVGRKIGYLIAWAIIIFVIIPAFWF